MSGDLISTGEYDVFQKVSRVPQDQFKVIRFNDKYNNKIKYIYLQWQYISDPFEMLHWSAVLVLAKQQHNSFQIKLIAKELFFDTQQNNWLGKLRADNLL